MKQSVNDINYIKNEFLNRDFNSFYFQFSDVNYVNCNFKDDLLKLSFYEIMTIKEIL